MPIPIPTLILFINETRTKGIILLGLMRIFSIQFHLCNQDTLK
jgi:hypothetical protein